MEFPKSFAVIPAVVKKKGIHLHAALLHQFAAKIINRIEAFCLVIFLLVPGDIEPGIVVQKRPVRMHAFAFEVSQKAAAQLAVRHHTHDSSFG